MNLNHAKKQQEEQYIKVEVAYALPDKQLIKTLKVPVGTTAYTAAVMSNIITDFHNIQLDQDSIGIFGKKIARPKEYVLSARDRVEIYRPLIVDPQQARLNRIKKLITKF